MAYSKKQIRYLKEGDARNSSNASYETLVAGTLFNTSAHITELKVSAIPGFGFYVNNTPWPIRVLVNGRINEDPDMFTYTFPANVLASQPIYNIKCEAESVKRLSDYNTAYPNDPHYLLIDYIEEVND